MNHIHYDQIDSTNAEARRLIGQGEVSHGTLITTDFQTNGQGQHSRNWESSKGQNVMMSLILRPVFLAIKDQYLLNVAVSLCLVDVLQEYTDAIIHVKWPNDIYVNHKKISGILIQNYLQGSKINYSVIGIGVNINQTSWSSEVPLATSLTLQSPQQNLDTSTICQEICKNIEQAYQVMQVSPKGLVHRYHELLLGYQKETTFKKGDSSISGVILGIDLQGRLRVHTTEGEVLWQHGEVQQVVGR